MALKHLFLSLLLLIPASPATASPRSWTVLVYWAVDNDLEEFSVPFLRNFEAAAPDAARIIVEIDHPGSRPTERIEIRPAGGARLNETAHLPHSRLIEEIGETDSGSAETLARFLAWGAERYPADHYEVVLASHGANWRGFAEDWSSGRTIPLEGVADALRRMNKIIGKEVDLVVMDACRMSFLETLYALRGTASLFVGSQFDLNGFDHRTVLRGLNRSPQPTALELAREYVRTYPLLYPREKNYGASLFSLSPALIEQDVEDLAEWARQRSGAGLRYTENEYGDRGIEIPSRARLAESDTEGSRHSGLSVNCPEAGDGPAYFSSPFAKAVPGWKGFCEWFSASRR